MHITHVVKNSKDVFYKADINTINNVMTLSTATSDMFPALDFKKFASIENVLDVALVIDGEYIKVKNRSSFTGDLVPKVFYIKSDKKLYGGYIDNVGSHEIYAENAICVSAVRGWSDPKDIAVTQGLVVAYIKDDNKAYYRNYCRQADGTYIWENEIEVTGITLPCRKVSLFKTNDYRVGFTFQTTSNEVYWLISDRTWATQAVGDEILTADLKDLKIVVHPVTYYNASNTEHLSVGLNDLNVKFMWGLSPVCQSALNPDAFSIVLTFDHILLNVTGQQAGFTVKDTNNIVFATTATAYGVDNKTLILTVSDFNNAKGLLTCFYDKTLANIYGEAGASVPLESFNISFTPTGLVPTAQEPPVVTAIYNAE